METKRKGEEDLKKYAEEFITFLDSENYLNTLQHVEPLDIEYGHQWDKYVDFLYKRNEPINNISKLIVIKNQVQEKWRKQIERIQYLLEQIKNDVLDTISYEKSELVSELLSHKINISDQSVGYPEAINIQLSIPYLMGLDKAKVPKKVQDLDLFISLFKSVTPQMVTIPDTIKSDFQTSVIPPSDYKYLIKQHKQFLNFQKHYCALEAIISEYFSHPLSKVFKWDHFEDEVAQDGKEDKKPGPNPDKYYPQVKINKYVKQLINIEDYIWDTEKKRGLYKKAKMADYILEKKFKNVAIKNQITDTAMIERINKALDNISQS